MTYSPTGGRKMKKTSTLIAGMMIVLLLCGCSSVNVNIKTADKDANAASSEQTEAADQSSDDAIANAPQLTSTDFDLSKTDDDNNKYFESHGNTWTMTEDSAAKYPKLAATLDKVSDSVKKYCQDTVDQNDADAKQFAEDNKQYDEVFQVDADMGLACVDEKVTSVVMTLFESLGGAHPSTVTVPYNIDSQSGEFIPLSAGISDQKGLNAMLKEKLIELYTDHNFFGLDESLDAMKMDATDFNAELTDPEYIWSFNPNGITFIFNPADISPYSDGGEQLDLTYEELAPVLEDHFKNLYSGE